MNKVLIVDDELEYLEILKKGLQKYKSQFQVLTASDGEEAIELLKKEYISVLVTDLVMPKVDGLELLAYMSSNHPQVPCIVMTGYGSPEIKKKADRDDILHYIEKPLDFDELAAAINKGLDRLGNDDFMAGVSVSGLLQIIDMEQKTCLLEVLSGNKGKGVFYFDNGVLLDASYGDLQGEEAALKMIGWDHVEFQFKSISNKNIMRRIDKKLMFLIMEGARLKDEVMEAGKKPDTVDTNELITQAIQFAEGNHFRRAQKMLIRLLEINPSNCDAWLWYSRIIGSMKAIESSLKNAFRISPKNLDVIEEIKKFNLAKEEVGEEQVRRCPFCWSPVKKTAVECQYCQSHLYIHRQFFTSARVARQDIQKKAIERYTKVISREKNVYAHYYLGMAYLNLEHWEEALDQLHKTDKLAPENEVFSDQLNTLLSYMASLETADKKEAFRQEGGSNLDAAPKAEVKKNKVLVVDDSSTTRMVVSITLSQKGYKVIEAQDGLEALTKLNDERPDLVLLDIILPGMDGYKILSFIKENSELKHIPVIMLTSKGKFFDKVKGRMAGSSEYLTKPFDPNDLAETVKKYMC